MPFPAELTNAIDNITEIVAAHLNNLEAKVGIDGSAVATSLDFLLKNPASLNPGHKHSKLWASDGNPEAVTVNDNGNVGIGTTEPNMKLHIYENNSAVAGYRVQNINAGISAQIQNVLQNNANSLSYFGITSSNFSVYPILNGGKAFFGSFLCDTVLFTQSAKDVIIGTNGAERVIIKSDGNIGIGTISPNAAALLHLSSTNKGFLLPVMTTAQKSAISTPPAGLLVYDSILNKLCVYNGSAWETVASS
jgi:hypothetical protein